MAVGFGTDAVAGGGGSTVTSQAITMPSGISAGDAVYILTFATPTTGYSTQSWTTTGVTTPSLLAAKQFNSGGVYITQQLWSFAAASGDLTKVLTLHCSVTSYVGITLVTYTGASPVPDNVSAFATGTGLTIAVPTVVAANPGSWGVYCASEIGNSITTYPGTERDRDSAYRTFISDTNGTVAQNSTVGSGNWGQASSTSWVALTFTVRPSGTIYLAQPAVINTSGLTSTLAEATTAGNTLAVAVCSYSASSSVTGITLGGSADHFAAAETQLATNMLATIWVDPDCAGGQTSVVVSGTSLDTGLGAGGIHLYEIAGLTAAAAVDQVASAATSGTTYGAGPTPVTTSAAEFWMGAAAAYAALATLPGSPWNSLDDPDKYSMSCFQVASSTGTPSFSGTGASGNVASVLVTIAQGPAGAPQYPLHPSIVLAAVNRASNW